MTFTEEKSRRGFVRKTVMGLVAVGAAAMMAFGGATAANAATGTENSGITKLEIRPDAPATDFVTPGTVGTLRFSIGDGVSPTGASTVRSGETRAWEASVPEGLKITSQPAACGTVQGGVRFDCAVSADGRTIKITQTQINNGTHRVNNNALSGFAVKVASTTGVVSGVPTGTFTPWPGIATKAPTTTGVVYPAPLLLGAGIAAAGLGAAAVIRKRNQAKAAV